MVTALENLIAFQNCRSIPFIHSYRFRSSFGHIFHFLSVSQRLRHLHIVHTDIFVKHHRSIVYSLSGRSTGAPLHSCTDFNSIHFPRAGSSQPLFRCNVFCMCYVCECIARIVEKKSKERRKKNVFFLQSQHGM